MKKYIGLFIALILSLTFNYCKKDEVKTVYSGGTAPVLSSPASTLNLVPADSNSNVITFNWTDPAYTFSNGASSFTVVHSIDVDSNGKDFSKAKSIVVNNVLTTSVNGRTFNKILSDLGMTDSSKNYSLSVRVRSSLYHASTALTSNIINITVSPYSTEPAPIFPFPANLFLVGDATVGGWANPVPVPAQKFTNLGQFKYGGIFQLNGGLKYLFLPVNGDWGHKYALNAANNTNPAHRVEGPFQPDAGPDIPGPTTTGLYKIIVDFVAGKYTVSPVTAAADIPPANLFLVGDATAGGWNNPVPVPSQQFTRVSSGAFEITVPLTGARKYLFLPENGSWTHKYAIQNAAAPGVKLGGTFIYDSGQDIPSPDETATYKIQVEFMNKTYKVTKQ